MSLGYPTKLRTRRRNIPAERFVKNAGVMHDVSNITLIRGKVLDRPEIKTSETGRIRFRRVRFQTPSSVNFFGLTEFQGASLSSETALPKQYSACFPKQIRLFIFNVLLRNQSVLQTNMYEKLHHMI